jgi:hypothetical protein
VNPYELAGLVAGVTGSWLFFLGTILAVGAGLRLVFVLRSPGKGAYARGVLTAGALLGGAGIAMFWTSRARPSAALDHAAPWIALAAAGLAALAGAWVARRRRTMDVPSPRGRGPTILGGR